MNTVSTIDVITPPNAHVWVQGMEMAKTGTMHHFMSPPLQEGPAYQYEVRAEWRQAGQDIARTRRVLVRPGGQFTVDFTRPRTEGY
jgi:uncharacterized protein (TIGR03000 family)